MRTRDTPRNPPTRESSRSGRVACRDRQATSLRDERLEFETSSLQWESCRFARASCESGATWLPSASGGFRESDSRGRRHASASQLWVRYQQNPARTSAAVHPRSPGRRVLMVPTAISGVRVGLQEERLQGGTAPSRSLLESRAFVNGVYKISKSSTTRLPGVGGPWTIPADFPFRK